MAGFRGLIGYRSSPSTVGERGGEKERLGERGKEEGWREREKGGKEREEGERRKLKAKRVTKFDNTL